MLYASLYNPVLYSLPSTHLQPSVLILKTLFRIVCSPSFMFYLPHSPSYSPTPDSVPILHSYVVCPVCLMPLTMCPPIPFSLCHSLSHTLCFNLYSVLCISCHIHHAILDFHSPNFHASVLMFYSACLMSDAPFSACLLLCPQSVPMYLTLRALVSTLSCYSRVLPSAPHPHASLSMPVLHTIVLLVCSLFVLHSPHSAVHIVFYCP